MDLYKLSAYEENQEDNHRTCMDDLPDECLSLVIKFLKLKSDRDSFALTCRRWLQIESGFRHCLQNFQEYLIDDDDGFKKTLLHLFVRFMDISSVSLAGCVQISDSSLLAFQSGCLRLENLSLRYCFNVNDTGLRYVADGCHALRILSLSRCRVSDTGLESIAQGCPNLERLDLSYCQNVTDTGVTALAGGCRNLSEVTISYCKLIEGWGFRNCRSLLRLEAESCKLTDAGLCKALQCFTALNCLNMANSQSGIRLGSVGLGSIGVACRLLQFLFLRMCRVLNDSAVKSIAQGCPKLKNWNMAVCPEVTFDGWDAVALFSSNLEILHVNRCKNFCDNSLLGLKNGCPSLRRLYLHGCPSLTAVALDGFKQARSEVQIVPSECMD